MAAHLVCCVGCGVLIERERVVAGARCSECRKARRAEHDRARRSSPHRLHHVGGVNDIPASSIEWLMAHRRWHRSVDGGSECDPEFSDECRRAVELRRRG